MSVETFAPSIERNAFNCPHCGHASGHVWQIAALAPTPKLPQLIDVKSARAVVSLVGAATNAPGDSPTSAADDPIFEKEFDKFQSWRVAGNLNVSRCMTCRGKAIWVHDKMVHPRVAHPVLPNPDMPTDVAGDFNEARQIALSSPRGAAALLRLCIQKLCRHLGQPGKNINTDIGALVVAGLDGRIQQALDIVRVVGNEAVHPGSMDLRDDEATVSQLFALVNLIVDRMISQPKQIDALYAKLPSGALEGVAKRDGGKS